jgi:LAS seventeen-binding protein 1/2
VLRIFFKVANGLLQELENLLEKGAITDSAYDSISGLLPTETPLSGHLGAPRGNAASGLASPAHSVASPISNTGTPVNAPPGPPTYAQSTGSATTLANPSKPVLTHARALYSYQASDARDVGFERDDRIAVFEYMNADWWMGQNLRTGQEGIFPRSYVMPEPGPGGMGGGMSDKQGYNNPYNANVPPMAIAAQGGAAGAQQQVQQQQQQPQQPHEPGKVEQGAKKFGKKLGNAAIFGAGATIGSNIVNSIF